MIAMLVLPAVAEAQSPTPPRFDITTDRDPIVQGEPFTLVISIATESAEDPAVRLPQFRGLSVLRQSESHPRSFSFSFSFGGQTQRQSKRTSNYTFVLVADQPGEYPIDPVLVTVDGRKYKSDPHTLRVVESSAAPPGGTALVPAPDRPASDPPPGTETVLDGAALSGAEIDPTCFVHLELSKPEAVVGEMVLLTVWLYTTIRISDVEVTREPGTEGFWVETLLPGQRRLSFEAVRVGDRPYDRAVLRRLALFPIEAGNLTVGPVMVNVESRSGGLFSRPKSIKRASPAMRISVAPLPEQGQPAGFDPANVGRFEYRVETDRTRIEVGEPLTLTISVSGEGNLRNIGLPLVTEVEGFRVYPPESEVDLRSSANNVTGSRTSRVLMIPSLPGTHTIPAIPWSFFDPATGEYRVLKSRPIDIEVKGGGALEAAGTAPSAGPLAVDRPGTGGPFDRLAGQLRSIESRASLTPRGDPPAMTRPWFLAAVLAGPLGYLVLLLGFRARRRAAESAGRDRSRRAGVVARKDLAALRRQMEQQPAAEFFGGLHKALVRFLESRLESAVAGDTMEQLRARLLARGFPEELAEGVVQELEGCDFARFARSAGAPGERRHSLERMEALIDRLAAVAVTRAGAERRR